MTERILYFNRPASGTQPLILLREPIGIKDGRLTSKYYDADHNVKHVAKDGFKVGDKWHGECISFSTDGDITGHCFYDNDLIVADFKNDLITDKEKFILKLTYTGEWLAN